MIDYPFAKTIAYINRLKSLTNPVQDLINQKLFLQLRIVFEETLE